MKSIWRGRGLLRRIRRGDDRGVALVIVVGTMLILAMLVLVSLAYAMGGQKFARYDQDYAAAQNAAQTGVDDFVSRLNRDATYGIKVDCTNVAWQGPMDPNVSWQKNDCGWGPNEPVGWVPATPGDTDPTHAQFHYVVDTSQLQSNGAVVVDVTGRVNGVYRTLETTIAKGGSTDYVYYTDFEDADPSNVQSYSTYPSDPACGSNPLHWWEGRKSGHNCHEITFASGDVLDGAVFTNDTILSAGASFKKQVETADPNCAKADGTTEKSGLWNTDCLRSGSTANFNGIQPKYHEALNLEDTSKQFETDPGCHYYGSTRVIFNGAQMTVWNQGTVNGKKAPVAIAPPGGTAPYCGTPDATGSINGQTMAVPDGMVVYAQSSGTAAFTCRAGDIGGPAGRVLPLGTYNAAAAAANGSYTIDLNMQDPDKRCGEGNLYAEGTLTGRVTIAAEQSVVVTGDLVVSGWDASNMLGLVAQNSVEVMHPWMATYKATTSYGCTKNCTYTWSEASGSETDAGSTVTSGGTNYSYASLGTWPTNITTSGNNGIEIDGSIQTLQHSFFVQKYDKGKYYGTLLVRGSIAQEWRGIVGQGVSAGSTAGTGYLKSYLYDERLTNARPPYFPLWANSEWSARYTGEIHTPTGVK